MVNVWFVGKDRLLSMEFVRSIVVHNVLCLIWSIMVDNVYVLVVILWSTTFAFSTMVVVQAV